MTSSPSFLSSAMRAFRGTAGALAGVAVLLTTACDREKVAPAAMPAVDVITITQKDVPIYMEWIASLDGNVNAVIRPQVTGYLIKQNYREGDLVKRGQPLFEIDPRTFEAAVDEAKGLRAQQAARYATTQANLARIKPLAAMNAVSQKDLDDATGADLSAKASLEAADASLRTAKLNLAFTKITSPVTGIAGIAKAQIGDLLSPTMPTELTTVSNVDPIKVYFNISEREYLKYAASAASEDKKGEHVALELCVAGVGVSQLLAKLQGLFEPGLGLVQVALRLGQLPQLAVAERQVALERGVAGVGLGQLLAKLQGLFEPGLGLAQVALRLGQVPQLVVAERQVALERGIAGVSLGQLLAQLQVLFEPGLGLAQVALCLGQVPQLVVADRQVALERGVAGVGLGQLLA